MSSCSSSCSRTTHVSLEHTPTHVTAYHFLQEPLAECLAHHLSIAVPGRNPHLLHTQSSALGAFRHLPPKTPREESAQWVAATSPSLSHRVIGCTSMGPVMPVPLLPSPSPCVHLCAHSDSKREPPPPKAAHPAWLSHTHTPFSASCDCPRCPRPADCVAPRSFSPPPLSVPAAITSAAAPPNTHLATTAPSVSLPPNRVNAHGRAGAGTGAQRTSI